MNRIHPALAFRLAVFLETSYLRANERCASSSGFWYEAVVETSFSLSQLKEYLCSQYPWSIGDTVDLQYFNFGEERFLPLMSDEDVGMLFTLNVARHFGRIRIDVVQPCRPAGKGKRVKAPSGGLASSGGRGSCVSDVSANTVRLRAHCRSTAVHLCPVRV